MSYGDLVVEIFVGFEVDVISLFCLIVVMSNKEKNMYGVQFYSEVCYLVYGNYILKNFVFEVCYVEVNWLIENFIEVEMDKICEIVGDRKVFCVFSGGVDFLVVVVLIYKVIGDQLICMFVDYGLLCKGEVESVMEIFSEGFNMNVIKIDVKDCFLEKLNGVLDFE